MKYKMVTMFLNVWLCSVNKGFIDLFFTNICFVIVDSMIQSENSVIIEKKYTTHKINH